MASASPCVTAGAAPRGGLFTGSNHQARPPPNPAIGRAARSARLVPSAIWSYGDAQVQSAVSVPPFASTNLEALEAVDLRAAQIAAEAARASKTLPNSAAATAAAVAMGDAARLRALEDALSGVESVLDAKERELAALRVGMDDDVAGSNGNGAQVVDRVQRQRVAWLEHEEDRPTGGQQNGGTPKSRPTNGATPVTATATAVAAAAAAAETEAQLWRLNGSGQATTPAGPVNTGTAPTAPADATIVAALEASVASANAMAAAAQARAADAAAAASALAAAVELKTREMEALRAALTASQTEAEALRRGGGDGTEVQGLRAQLAEAQQGATLLQASLLERDGALQSALAAADAARLAAEDAAAVAAALTAKLRAAEEVRSAAESDRMKATAGALAQAVAQRDAAQATAAAATAQAAQLHDSASALRAAVTTAQQEAAAAAAEAAAARAQAAAELRRREADAAQAEADLAQLQRMLEELRAEQSSINVSDATQKAALAQATSELRKAALAQAEASATIEALRADMTAAGEAMAEVQSLRDELSAAHAALAPLRVQLAARDVATAQLRLEVADARSALAARDATADELHLRIGSLQTELETQQAAALSSRQEVETAARALDDLLATVARLSVDLAVKDAALAQAQSAFDPTSVSPSSALAMHASRGTMAQGQTQAAAQAARDGLVTTARRLLGGSGVCKVRFMVRYTAWHGESVRLVGDDPALGAWDPSRGLPLRHTNGIWAADVALPSGRVHAYKYVLCDAAGNFLAWQGGADAVLMVARSDERLEVRDDWSNDPTLSTVLQPPTPEAAAAGAQPVLSTRQARVTAVLNELAAGVNAAEAAEAALERTGR